MTSTPFKHLVSGYDTIECAYYLTISGEECGIDYVALMAQRDALRAAKVRNSTLELGGEKFLFYSHGTKSGYPLLIENNDFSIQFGQFNKPNFFVTYSSFALWHYGLEALHQRFMRWATFLGLRPYHPERLSRVDMAFDYHLPSLDFSEENFLSKATKDNKHRKNGVAQTFRFGAKDTVLRVYNKSDEIAEHSNKTWFYRIWQLENGIWRIEWQVRKTILRQLGIHTIEDLAERDGDLCQYLLGHTSLRLITKDSNKSRWPVHPLWLDLAEQMENRSCQGILREYDTPAFMEERLQRNAISIYGYLKRLAAIRCVMQQQEHMPVEATFHELERLIRGIHDPLSWKFDVEKRIKEMEAKVW